MSQTLAGNIDDDVLNGNKFFQFHLSVDSSAQVWINGNNFTSWNLRGSYTPLLNIPSNLYSGVRKSFGNPNLIESKRDTNLCEGKWQWECSSTKWNHCSIRGCRIWLVSKAHCVCIDFHAISFVTFSKISTLFSR